MTTAPPYIQGADLPDLTIEWTTNTGAIIDFSSGYTFELKIGSPGSAATLTKTTGITGAATLPNVTIAWATSGELNTLPPDSYIADLIATRTSDSKQRKRRFNITVYPAIT